MGPFSRFPRRENNPSLEIILQGPLDLLGKSSLLELRSFVLVEEGSRGLKETPAGGVWFRVLGDGFAAGGRVRSILDQVAGDSKKDGAVRKAAKEYLCNDQMLSLRSPVVPGPETSPPSQQSGCRFLKRSRGPAAGAPRSRGSRSSAPLGEPGPPGGRGSATPSPPSRGRGGPSRRLRRPLRRGGGSRRRAGRAPSGAPSSSPRGR